MWSGSAPSNIALIKYMGKKQDGKNQSTNPSLSWTTDHLRTFMEIEKKSEGEDSWESHPKFPMELSQAGQEKFLNFAQKLKEEFGLSSNSFTFRSGNNFPADCGIASSASSFAALTITLWSAAKDLNSELKISHEDLPMLSRQGSGSSCRSFSKGWVSWQDDGVTSLDSPLTKLTHYVVIVSGEKKKVSSSEAHQKIQTSLLNDGRSVRARNRFNEVLRCLQSSTVDWELLYQITWEDFWDMHTLFETSRPSFSYMTEESLKILRSVQELWASHGDGPIVTMDAGPNVHLLWREDQKQMALDYLTTGLTAYKVIGENDV